MEGDATRAMTVLKMARNDVIKPAAFRTPNTKPQTPDFKPQTKKAEVSTPASKKSRYCYDKYRFAECIINLFSRNLATSITASLSLRGASLNL